MKVRVLMRSLGTVSIVILAVAVLSGCAVESQNQSFITSMACTKNAFLRSSSNKGR